MTGESVCGANQRVNAVLHGTREERSDSERMGRHVAERRNTPRWVWMKGGTKGQKDRGRQDRGRESRGMDDGTGGQE